MQRCNAMFLSFGKFTIQNFRFRHAPGIYDGHHRQIMNLSKSLSSLSVKHIPVGIESKISLTPCAVSLPNSLLQSQMNNNIIPPFTIPIRFRSPGLKAKKIRPKKKYKIKTHTGTKHRFKISGIGVIFRKTAGARHRRRKKSRTQLKRLKQWKIVAKCDRKMIRRSLPNGVKRYRK